MNQNEKNITFEIASPSEDAAKLVMAWRNDPETLKQSFHQDAKRWPQFYSEFKEEYFQDPILPCLFAILEGRRIAFLRFRRVVDKELFRQKVADVSINLDPKYRGKGLGTSILIAMLPILKSLGLSSLWAEVKVENLASCKVFQRAGFEFVGDFDHLVKDSGDNVSIKRFKYDLVSSISEIGLGQSIGDGYPCFIIAEAGSNWRMGTETRDMQMAKTLIEIASQAGCNAVKFQTYRPETTYVENAGESDYLSSSGIKQPINEIFADLSMPYEMLEELSNYCQKEKILFMSSAFSVRDFEEVDRFSMIHKIASYEITHVRLLEAAARANKPLILSTGASNVEDVTFAVEKLKAEMKASFSLMQCTAKYPAPISSMNLGTISSMKQRYGVPVGLSDHSLDAEVVPAAAIAAGANLYEKHYTVSRNLPGPDHKFAINPDELKNMVSAIRKAEEALGDGVKRVLKEEEELHQFARRGIQAVREIDKGVKFVEGENFEILRPGNQKLGMHPRYISKLENSKSNRLIRVGEGIQPSDIEEK